MADNGSTTVEELYFMQSGMDKHAYSMFEAH